MADTDNIPFNRSNMVSATAVLKQKYPGRLEKDNNIRSKKEFRQFVIFTSCLLTLILIVWLKWNYFSIVQDQDFIYYLGLVGGVLMSFSLLYAMKKRLPKVIKFGSLEQWYQFHLITAVSGSFLIVFHTSFAIKSINSLAAVVAMLCIVFSGAIGRYLYTRVAFCLYEYLQSVNETEVQLYQALEKYDNQVIAEQISKLTTVCINTPNSFYSVPYHHIKMRIQAIVSYMVITSELVATLKAVCKHCGWSKKTYINVLNNDKNHLRDHIKVLSRISLRLSYERMLVRWRMLHTPILIILVLTALGHVYAVHIY